jgi:hypothetical protein
MFEYEDPERAAEWDRKQKALEDRLKAAGVDEFDISRSCWRCRDTSQCDEACAVAHRCKTL